MSPDTKCGLRRTRKRPRGLLRPLCGSLRSANPTLRAGASRRLHERIWHNRVKFANFNVRKRFMLLSCCLRETKAFVSCAGRFSCHGACREPKAGMTRRRLTDSCSFFCGRRAERVGSHERQFAGPMCFCRPTVTGVCGGTRGKNMSGAPVNERFGRYRPRSSLAPWFVVAPVGANRARYSEGSVALL